MNYNKIKANIIFEINKMDEITDSKVYDFIEKYILEEYKNKPIKEKIEIIKKLFNGIRKLGILQELLDDDEITEIMINGYKVIYIEKNGKIIKSDIVFESREELMQIIQKIVGTMDRKVNEKYPICDVRLIDGSRVNIVLNPVGIEGPYVTIRKFPKKKFNYNDIIANKTITKEGMNFLRDLVYCKYNIFVSGGTSSGKTTLLNILSDMIRKSERIITIEDSAELRLNNVENLVRLETRVGDLEYTHHIPIKDLIKSSLRMRPDRIIVGEVRGEEAIDMLQAMNTGHDGSLSTGHSNSIRDMLYRLETMVLSGMEIPLMAIRQQISSAIDIMVHVSKVSGKGRRVIEIAEIMDIKDGEIGVNSLYKYNYEKDMLIKQDNSLINVSKLDFLGGESG